MARGSANQSGEGALQVGPASFQPEQARAGAASESRDAQRWRRQSWPLHMRVSERRLLLIIGDVIANVFAILIALFLWAQRAGKPFTTEYLLQQAHWFFLLPLLWFLLASANDYYNLGVAAKFSRSAGRLFRIVLEVLGIYLLTFFLATPGTLPRRFIVYYAVASVTLIGAWRAARIFLIGWTQFRRRAIILGGGPAAQLIWSALKEEASGDYEPLGYVMSEEAQARKRRQGPGCSHFALQRSCRPPSANGVSPRSSSPTRARSQEISSRR